MITINVSGIKDRDNTEVDEIINIINSALTASGNTPFVVGEAGAMTHTYPSHASCIITRQFLRDSSKDSTFDDQNGTLLRGIDAVIKAILPYDYFEFLIGRTESEAYELVQEHGALVRIVSRNDIPMAVTRDYNRNRVNLSIYDNMVVGWTYG
jgi:hypothetical protein